MGGGLCEPERRDAACQQRTSDRGRTRGHRRRPGGSGTRTHVRGDDHLVRRVGCLGIELDPMTGFRNDAGVVILADGDHRALLMRGTAARRWPVKVFPGGLSTHVYGIRADARKNGLPRTHEDKQRAIKMAFNLPWLKDRSDTEIGKWCGVSDKTVAKVREELGIRNPHAKSPRIGRGPRPTKGASCPAQRGAASADEGRGETATRRHGNGQQYEPPRHLTPAAGTSRALVVRSPAARGATDRARGTTHARGRRQL